MGKKEGRYSRDRKGIHHGFYGGLDLHKIDGRSRIGRMVKALKYQLREFVGEEGLTPAVEILLERIIFKTVRLCMYEGSRIDAPVEKEGSTHYLAMANSLRSDLQVLSEVVRKVKAPSLEDLLRNLGS